MSAAQALAGLRVLVVEDDMLVSLAIEDLLADYNCKIVGPHTRVPSALEDARSKALDFALLDVNLVGAEVYPVAEVLASRKVPFLFLTAYGASAVPADRPGWRVFSKPFRFTQLVDAMLKELERA